MTSFRQSHHPDPSKAEMKNGDLRRANDKGSGRSLTKPATSKNAPSSEKNVKCQLADEPVLCDTTPPPPPPPPPFPTGCASYIADACLHLSRKNVLCVLRRRTGLGVEKWFKKKEKNEVDLIGFIIIIISVLSHLCFRWRRLSRLRS